MDRSTESDRPWAPPSVETVPVPSCGDLDPSRRAGAQPRTCDGQAIRNSRLRLGRKTAAIPSRYLPEGNFNNVDLRTGAWGRDDLTIAVASGRQPAELVVFELDHASSSLRLVGRNEPVVDEPYGVYLYLDESGQPWAVLNGKDGLFVQFELHPDQSVSEARRWRTRTQPEGCVADDDTGLLYVGEENHGVWTLLADPRQPAELAVFAKVADGILSADVEGMALYRAPGETRTDLVGVEPRR